MAQTLNLRCHIRDVRGLGGPNVVLRPRRIHHIVIATAQKGNVPLECSSVTNVDQESTSETIPCSIPTITKDDTHIEVHPSKYGNVLRSLAIGAAVCVTLVTLPFAANASEFAPAGILEAVIHTVETLGPLGPVAFVLAVAFFESIPLCPTQPLSLASGILFGATNGAIFMLMGTTSAALIAFFISRGIGRPLAERIIKSEMAAESSSNSSTKNSKNSPAAALAQVTEAIERGSFWQQSLAVFLVRMTPVLPFSASSYILGLSPLPLAPYAAGTILGMSFWAAVYACIGSASRSLVRSGTSVDTLIRDIIEKAGGFSEATTIAVIGAALAGAVAYMHHNSNTTADSSDDTQEIKGDGILKSVDFGGIFSSSSDDESDENIQDEQHRKKKSSGMQFKLPDISDIFGNDRELVEHGGQER